MDIKKFLLAFLITFFVSFVMFCRCAHAWDHTVIMFPPDGATFTVPLVPNARTCVYVTDCSAPVTTPPVATTDPVTDPATTPPDPTDPITTPPDPPEPVVADLPAVRDAYGWSFGLPIDRSGWTVTADTWEALSQYNPSVVLDGDINTKWHTPFKSTNTQKDTPHPHELIVDMGSEHWVDSLIYTPRLYDPATMTDNYKNGILKDYEVWVSKDKNAWGRVANGTLDYSDGYGDKTILFLIPNLARYVKIVFLSDILGSPYSTAAEINITESLKDIEIQGGGI